MGWRRVILETTVYYAQFLLSVNGCEPGRGRPPDAESRERVVRGSPTQAHIGPEGVDSSTNTAW